MNPYQFSHSVECGLKLAKRIYIKENSSVGGEDRSFTSHPPKPLKFLRSSSASFLHEPTAPMIYAVIYDPAMVDNPDVESYQPHVHGKCDPPALIPLHMKEIEMEVDSWFDKAFVTVRGLWRLHCVIGSRRCDCRLVVPMVEQGSILGAEINVAGRSYSTQLVRLDEIQNMEKTAKLGEGRFLKPQIFSLTIPQVDGGSTLSVKIHWFQQLSFKNGEFSINVPFSFPEYVNPTGQQIASNEKIQLNVNTGIEKEVTHTTSSHPMKEIRRQMGKLGFLYDVQVRTWSRTDFNFSYEVPSNEIYGALSLQAPSMHDFDQREIFCLYLFPGNNENRKVFRKEVVFLIDISGSMQGRPLENTRKAVEVTLSKFTQTDSFNLIAFNSGTYSFSSSLELATKETIGNATQWMNENCVAGGGTNILDPLNEAMGMLSSALDSCSQIFLITDGTVEDEQNICHIMKSHIRRKGSTSPRISTFGLGLYCNHYFLRMLASIGRGHYDASFDADSFDLQMEKFFTRSSSAVLRNIVIDNVDHLDSFEVYPFSIPDLLSECPLLLSGRYLGKFPDSLKAKGVLADMTDTVIDLKVKHEKDIPLDKVSAKQQIELLTSQAWFTENRDLEEKVVKLSIQTGVISEYTRMALHLFIKEKLNSELLGAKKAHILGAKDSAESKDYQVILLSGLTVRFGSITATVENAPTAFADANLVQSNNLFSKGVRQMSWLCDFCCCYCCLRACSKMNNQCALVLTQLCTALSCFGCISCCFELFAD